MADMGLIKNVGRSVKAVGTLVSGIREMARENEAQALMAPVAILNPTPQADVDRLIAAGGITRGVVIRASHQEQHGERAARMRVDVRVRARLADGALGDPVLLKIWTSWKVAALLDPGLEIPILMDRATGLATEIPRDELARELEPRFDEAGHRRPGWVTDPDVAAALSLPKDVADAVRRRQERKRPG